MRFTKIGFTVTALILLLITANYFSPHWTIYRMRVAIEKRDYKAFSSHANFPALRESLKGQLLVSENTIAGSDKSAENVLGRFGQHVTGLLFGPVVDMVASPAGVIEMLNAGRPGITRAVVTSTLTQVPTATREMPAMKVFYQGWNQVSFQGADATEKDGSFILIRSGLWKWQLSAVMLPRPS